MASSKDSAPVRFIAGRWRTLAAGALVVVTVGGAALVTSRLTLRHVMVDTGDRVWRYYTRAETVGHLLDEAQITLEAADVVSPEPATPLRNGMTVTVRKAQVVALMVDGQTWPVRTQAAAPGAILADQAVELGPHDVVLVDGQPVSQAALNGPEWVAAPRAIQVIRSMSITVIDGDRSLQAQTTQIDVGRALDEIGLVLYVADRVTPDLGTPVSSGLTITIERSVPVTVVADGRQLNTRARGPTVANALAAIGLAPVGQDYTVPPLHAPVKAGMVIRLVRVTKKLPRLSSDDLSPAGQALVAAPVTEHPPYE